ncbi:MAG TPA: fatty acid desaturase [Candidatus Omnitrophota bacterium]|nr:fatty acid desaturase [Candidatus Omnitrophota bacterium]
MEQAYLKKRPDLISLLIVAGHFLVVFGPVYASAIWGPGYHLITAWLIFGLGMNGIINLMHECAHYLVFQEKLGSRILGKYIIAPLLFTNFNIYRRRHWEHHKHLGVEGETKDTYLIDIKGSHIFFLFLRCIFGIEAFKKFFKQLDSIVVDELYPHEKSWKRRTLLIQLGFYLSLILSSYLFGQREGIPAFLNASIAYLFVYIYGVMSLTIFIADLRAIAEHQLYDPREAHEGYAALRNFKCTPLTRFIMGAYGFGEHYTHHKIPGVPYYVLKKATNNLIKEDPSLMPQKGYFQTILEITKRPGKSNIHRS